MLMMCTYHVNMYHTHFQSFKHGRTSVVTILAKYIFGVALGVIRRKVVSLRKVCYSCVLSVPHCVIK